MHLSRGKIWWIIQIVANIPFAVMLAAQEYWQMMVVATWLLFEIDSENEQHIGLDAKVCYGIFILEFLSLTYGCWQL